MLERIAHILRVSPEGDQALAMRALRAYATRDRVEIARVTAELQQARAITVAIAFADVALYSGDLAGADELARGFLQVARAPELRALCHILLAHLALAAGGVERMRAELALAESLDRHLGARDAGAVRRAALPARVRGRAARRARRARALGPGPGGAEHVRDLRDAQRAASRHPGLPARPARAPPGRSAIGRRAAARRWPSSRPAARWCGTSRSSSTPRWRTRRGRDAEALARLERARPELWFQLTVASPLFSLASQRFLRAQLLEAVGRHAEAAGWYRAMAERSPYELIYAGAAREGAARAEKAARAERTERTERTER